MQPEAVFQLLFKTTHEHLEATMADVTDQVANWLPERIVASIGAQYVHLLTTEDVLINAVLKGGAPLMGTTFAGKVGTAEPPQFFTWGEWGRTQKVDITAARAYAKAVYESVESYVATLDGAQLEKIVDLTSAGLGKMPVASVLEIALRQPYVHGGEISALKGLQSMKGYPV